MNPEIVQQASGQEETKWQFRKMPGMRGGVTFFSYGTSHFSRVFLVFFILLFYLPFMGSRMVRPAGDDKVYVSQAVEMASSGHWFLQTLGGEPNYYKGPLHYILLRIGMLLFGSSMWATVYMNLLLVIAGALALGTLVQRHMKEFQGWAFWVALAFAVNAGIYAHMFASQMEVEAASLMAIGLYFLDAAGPGAGDLRFWLLAGFLGWVKSPLHSVLLGCTALLFWGWNRELLPRLASLKAWGAALVGIAVCAIAYAPAFLFDRTAFIFTYIDRETLWKPANGAPWHYPVIPLFTYYLFPWMLPAFVVYADGLSRNWRRQRLIRTTAGSKRILALGICLIIPSLAFFMWHPYRGQNYDLPVIGGLILAVASIWATRAASWNGIYAFSLALTALLMLALAGGLTIITRHFDPMPFWWSSWRLPLIWLGAFLTARGFWREGVSFHMLRPDSLARRSLWLFLALGGLLATLGEREMIDIRLRVERAISQGERLHMSYYNLEKNIWSEWGYLNFMIPYPVRGLFNEGQLRQAVNAGDLILVPSDEWLADMHQRLDKTYPATGWQVEPWKRWKTKGKNAQGVPAWQEAWDSHDISRLERNAYMVKIRAEKGPGAPTLP